MAGCVESEGWPEIALAPGSPPPPLLELEDDDETDGALLLELVGLELDDGEELDEVDGVALVAGAADGAAVIVAVGVDIG